MTKKKTSTIVKAENQSVEYQPEIQQDQGNMIQVLLTKAIDKNVPVETLERLLAMRDKLKAEQAKEAFDVDMAEFQGQCPIINKTKEVHTNNGQLAFKYAPLESIVDQVKKILTSCNLSYSTQTETLDGLVKATCTAKHMLGHSESSSMTVPLGNKTQIMSQTQVVVAALSLAKRYAFCNVFGIMTGDNDDEKMLKPKAEKEKKNYLDLLKIKLYKNGAKNTDESIKIFNKLTGQSVKALPTKNDDTAFDMYEDLLNSPMAK